MKNKILYKLKNKIKLQIVGKNINRFIMRLNTNNIEILRCDTIEKEKIQIIIYESDYEKVEKLKTIYNIEKLDVYGMIKIKKQLNRNKYIILSMIIGYAILILLCNTIFEIEIIHNEEEIRTFLKTELRQHGIKEKKLKKSYHTIEKIKEDILNKYRDKIEWLEIETIGTKYVVRVELRKINEKQEEQPNRNIIAKKDAVIKKIEAIQGQPMKEINNYVKKGDIIISGNIYAEQVIKNTITAEGKVFGEVWYETSVTYPFVYNETKLTNETKNIIVLKLLNKTIELTTRPFKDKKIEETTIIKNNILPISIAKQEQTKQEVIEQILTTDEALTKAIEKAIEQMENNLKEDEYIINYKILNSNIKENELELNIFFAIYEDITDYEIITNEEINGENDTN